MSNYTKEIKAGEYTVELNYVPFSQMSYIKKIINDFIFECYDVPEESYDTAEGDEKIDSRRSYGFVIMRNILKVTAEYGDKLTKTIEPAIAMIEGKPGTLENIEMLCSLLDSIDLNLFLGEIRDFEIDIEDKKKLFIGA